MAWTSGIVGSTFRRYITIASAFIGPYINPQNQADYSKMLYSVDGLTWSYGSTNRPVIMQGKTPSGLYYGYYQDKFLTSTDRNNWIETGSLENYPGTLNNFSQIVYAENGNFFLAIVSDIINYNDYSVGYSTDGVSWTRATGTVHSSLTYANYSGIDRLVLSSYDQSGTFDHSSNGFNWSTISLAGLTQYSRIISVNNKILAFTDGAAGGYTSTMFELAPQAVFTYAIPSGRYRGLAYGSGKYILLDYYPPASYDGARITTSTNLSSWTARAIVGSGLPNGPAYGMSWNDIIYGLGQGFRIFSNYGDSILYSSDGNTWARQPVEYGTDTSGILLYWSGTYQV